MRMPKKKVTDNFIMSPKIDFVFKLLFGDEKNKDLLISFLSAVLNLPESEFDGVEILNTELFREFKEDKKGILDIRAKTKEGKQIDIEIQVLPTDFMPERTLFYWSKMYTMQVKPGDTYNELKKCITINIVDFVCTPLKKIHSCYHLKEDETGFNLTDVLEVHFLEIPKLFDKEIQVDENSPIVQWMEFLDGKSKGVMEMLAKKNENIKKAYDLLQIISKDEKARMIYEAREAELRDQLTRIKSAEEKGLNEGINIGEDRKAIRIAEKMIKRGDSVEDIMELTELTKDTILELMKKHSN